MTETPTITLPAELPFEDRDTLRTAYLDRYFRGKPEDPIVQASYEAVRKLADSDGWFRQELDRKLEEMDRALRILANAAAGALENLHAGHLTVPWGFSQVDSAARATKRIPAEIRAMLDAACNFAIVQAREAQS